MANPWKSKGGRRQTIGVLLGAPGATPSSTYHFEASFDGTNWFTISVFKDGAAVTGYPNSIVSDNQTAAGFYSYQVQFGWYPYLRISVTANVNVVVSNAWLTEDGIAVQGTLVQTTITGNNSDQ